MHAGRAMAQRDCDEATRLLATLACLVNHSSISSTTVLSSGWGGVEGRGVEWSGVEWDGVHSHTQASMSHHAVVGRSIFSPGLTIEEVVALAAAVSGQHDARRAIRRGFSG